MTEYNSLISGGGETARENLTRFLETRTINGIEVNLHPDYEGDWRRPYEDCGFPDGTIKYAVLQAGVDVDDWLRLSYLAHEPEPPTELTEDPTEFEDWDVFVDHAYTPTVESVAEDIKNGDTDDIPMPLLEIRPDYEVTYGEGRSRGLGAKRAGIDVMPVWIAAMDYI